MTIGAKLPPQFLMIGSDWSRLHEVNTSGTRDKTVVLSPYGQMYYFKTSLEKKTKKYPFEFWSEIAASSLGLFLNLPILPYHIACCNSKIGCVSESLIDVQSEELIEGVNFILEIEPNFRSYCKKGHTLERIENALKAIDLLDLRRLIIEMVLFDCIIGNTDRHSENWALIRNKQGESFYSYLMSMNFIQRWFQYWRISKESGVGFLRVHKIIPFIRHRFAPFYDNGSSLGRELPEERIATMLNDEEAFQRFFENGTSDIIIGESKTSFLNTIDLLLENFPSESGHFISNHLSLYNKKEFSSLISNIDANYPPEGFEQFRISNNRKAFIVKLVDARIQYIYNKIKQYVNKI